MLVHVCVGDAKLLHLAHQLRAEHPLARCGGAGTGAFIRGRLIGDKLQKPFNNRHDNAPSYDCGASSISHFCKNGRGTLRKTAHVLVEGLSQCALGRDDRKQQRQKLYRAEHRARDADGVFVFAQHEQHAQHAQRREHKAADVPCLSKVAVCKLPCVLIFHRHARPVAKDIIDLCRRMPDEIAPQKQHRQRDQQHHGQHKEPETHRVFASFSYLSYVQTKETQKCSAPGKALFRNTGGCPHGRPPVSQLFPLSRAAR